MRTAITRFGFVISLIGIVLFAPGAAFAAVPPTVGNLGHNGPSVPQLGDPVATISEVQWMTVTPVTTTPGGTYKLGTDLGDTAAIGYKESPQTALRALYGASDVAVVGGPTSTNFDANGNLKVNVPYFWRVMWVSGDAGKDIATMTVVGAAITLTDVTVVIDAYQNGSVVNPARTQPHGGYNATTDYCLQCHSVHDGAEYALLASSSVTATCRTCHSIGGTGGSGVINPGFPGVEAPTSMRSAYEVSGARAQHRLGATNIPSSTVGTITQSGWSYGGFSPTGWSSTTPAGPGTASDVDGGLYCGDCHTPHGDFGQLVNSKFYRSSNTVAGAGGVGDANLSNVQNWVEGAVYQTGSTSYKYLHKDTDPNVWESCAAAGPAAVAGGPDSGCTYLLATDTEGESAYLYGYKLLSAYPNHSWNEKPVSWNMDKYSHDQSQWCGRCHDKALPSQYGGTYHNHPTGCTSCHGNPNDGTSTDFPHTSTFQSFLKDYPDLLCINCHTAGSLP
jgi:predicted CXXCH cytochrome family protein